MTAIHIPFSREADMMKIVLTILIVLVISCYQVPADVAQMPDPPTFSYHQWASGEWNIAMLSTPAYPAGVDPRYEIQMLGGKARGSELSDLMADGAPSDVHLLRDWNASGNTISFGASHSPFSDALAEAGITWAALRIRTVDANEGYMPSDWAYIAAVYGVHLRPGP